MELGGVDLGVDLGIDLGGMDLGLDLGGVAPKMDLGGVNRRMDLRGVNLAGQGPVDELSTVVSAGKPMAEFLWNARTCDRLG